MVLVTAIVYLNGKFLPQTAAQVSVFDRGFLFGDGAFEVIPVYAGKPLHLQQHLLRLHASLQKMLFPADFSVVTLDQQLHELIARNNFTQDTGYFYLQVTRGGNCDRDYYLTNAMTPTIFAFLKKTPPISYDLLSRGKSAILLDDIRWQYCSIKSTSLLASVLLYEQVRLAGCDEGILQRNGYINEGITTNVFMVKAGIVVTPPLAENNLSGVTRDIILQLLSNLGIECKISMITSTELFQAAEVWVTSSTRGIYPIIKLSDKIIGDGKVGPVWQKVIRSYLDYCAAGDNSIY